MGANAFFVLPFADLRRFSVDSQIIPRTDIVNNGQTGSNAKTLCTRPLFVY